MLLEATIEEFEQGTWVAHLVQSESFSGSFKLPDGSNWIGTKIEEVIDKQRHFITVVGGKGGLSKQLKDEFLDGTSLQAAVQQICSNIGESFGGATPGTFLSQYQRQLGAGGEVLDKLAETLTQIWWIGRDGLLQMQAKRPTGAEVSGTRDMDGVDVDSSIELVQPSGIVLGAQYKGQPIRHVRWKMNEDRFSARIFFVPFIFRPPTNQKYASLYNAKIDSDNGDGTVNVIADGRFGVTRAPLFCGVPGSKVTMHPGEQVMVGFWGGDPQKPYCVAMAQDPTATKQAARSGDLVQLDSGATIAATIAGPAPGPILSGPVTLTLTAPAVPGRILTGSSRISIGD